jgi:hypothetical protein
METYFVYYEKKKVKWVCISLNTPSCIKRKSLLTIWYGISFFFDTKGRKL